MFPARHQRRPLILSLMLIAASILLYVLSQRFHIRRDLTRNHLYSLNRETIDLLQRLEDPVRFTLYVSEELPPAFRPVFDFTRTLIEEYAHYGAGKVVVTYLDPHADLEAVEAAHQAGISETMANMAADDRVAAVNLWFGMVVSYRDHNQVFPDLQSIENLELEITSALVRLTRTEKPHVCFIGPTYEEGKAIVFDIARDIKPIREELSKLFNVSQIRLEPETELDLTGVEAVFVWSLHHFSERQLYALDQYIMASGSVLLLFSNMRIDPVYLTAQPVPDSRADDFSRHLGFQVNRDLVCDTRNVKIRYTDTRPPVLESYPLFPEIDLQGDAPESVHPSVAGLKSLVLPWGSSLQILRREGIRTAVIGTTSQQGWLQTGPWEISPKKITYPASFNRYPVGLALSGRFPSFFPSPPAGVTPRGRHLARCEKETTVLVWSSEHLLTQAQNKPIIAWASQTADYLTQGFNLAGIDRREHALQPIRDLSHGEKTTYKWLSITLGPLFVLAFALARWFLRRRRGPIPRAPGARTHEPGGATSA